MTQSFTLTASDLTASISPLGARLHALHLRGGPNLVLHADAPEWQATYAGAIVGPVANRVRGGMVRIDGHSYPMVRNENDVTALHSGPDGLHARIWSVVAQEAHMLHLRCSLPDGACGLPGNRRFDVIYSIGGLCLGLEIRATTDAPTPISIAHHPYWRLGAPADHLLQIHADTYLPVDAHNIPTGEVLAVAHTRFDHRSPRAIDPATDHNFCVSQAPRSAPAPVATLTGTDGLTLRIDSTEPGLQAYAGAYLPALPANGIGPWAGIALEPQGWPNAVNTPDFPSILTTADVPYRQMTQYILSPAT